MHRRRLIQILAAAACLPRCADAAKPVKAVGLFSMLGDTLDISLYEDPAASRMERAKRETLQVPNMGFDQLVAAEVRRHMTQALPTVSLHPFTVGTPLKASQQKQIADEARRGALPGFILDRVQESQLAHLLLVTRQRTGTSLITANGERIGRGDVEGLGFYLDSTYRVRNQEGRHVAQGALGPHVVVGLTLFDVEEAGVGAEALINQQWLAGPKPGTAPWDYLTAQEKVLALREALQSGLREQLPQVLKAGG